MTDKPSSASPNVLAVIDEALRSSENVRLAIAVDSLMESAASSSPATCHDRGHTEVMPGDEPDRVPTESQCPCFEHDYRAYTPRDYLDYPSAWPNPLVGEDGRSPEWPHHDLSNRLLTLASPIGTLSRFSAHRKPAIAERLGPDYTEGEFLVPEYPFHPVVVVEDGEAMNCDCAFCEESAHYESQRLDLDRSRNEEDS